MYLKLVLFSVLYCGGNQGLWWHCIYALFCFK